MEYFTEEGEFYTDPTLLDPTGFSQPLPPPPSKQQQQQKQQKQQAKKPQPNKKKQQGAKKQQHEATTEKPKKSDPSDDVVAKYKEMILEFSKKVDGPDALNLPSNLTSYVRMKIHDYASTIVGITHESEGEGKERHIVIRKKKEIIKGKEEEEEEEDVIKISEEKKEFKEEEEEVIKISEEKKEIEENVTELNNEKKEDIIKDEEKPVQRKVQQKKQQQKKQQQKNKKKVGKGSCPTGKCQAKKQKAIDTKGMDEVDAALAELGIDTDTDHCAYRDPKTNKRCREKVTLIYATCKYCNMKFCFAHVQAEVHGCGAAAKRLARAQVNQQYNEIMKQKKMSGKK